jgi:hypothetical protein
MIKDLDIYNTVQNSISTCKGMLLNNDVQAIQQWWIVENGYGNFENMSYASAGPRFYIYDFGFLSKDEVEIIYELDRQNAQIISTALNTGDLSKLPIALDNLDKISELYLQH